MPFIFFCSRCGSALYEDPSPLLQDGSYKSPTYFECILAKLGYNCPYCGHELHVPPLSIEVLTTKRTDSTLRTRGIEDAALQINESVRLKAKNHAGKR